MSNSLSFINKKATFARANPITPTHIDNQHTMTGKEPQHARPIVRIADVKAALERFSPLPLQEDYDNAGLQVGLTTEEVSGVVLCLDVTEQVVGYAARQGCNLIVSHHPLIFRPLRHIGDATYVERCVMQALRAGITILSMHTNMDNAYRGVSYTMAEHLGLIDVDFLQSKGTIPEEGGSGVIGQLPEAMPAADFIGTLKTTFGCGCVMANELLQRPIRRVALCGGSGAFLAQEAINQQADAFVTGEMHYHEYFGLEQQLQLCIIGHYESEQYAVQRLGEVVRQALPDVRLKPYPHTTNPVHYF